MASKSSMAPRSWSWLPKSPVPKALCPRLRCQMSGSLLLGPGKDNWMHIFQPTETHAQGVRSIYSFTLGSKLTCPEEPPKRKTFLDLLSWSKNWEKVRISSTGLSSPSNQEVEAGWLWAGGQPGLHCKTPSQNFTKGPRILDFYPQIISKRQKIAEERLRMTSLEVYAY